MYLSLHRIAVAMFLFILGIIIPIDSQASNIPYNSDYCDAMYSELFFQEVPHTIQKECWRYFHWKTQRIIRNHP
jgi:hypothetical protein